LAAANQVETENLEDADSFDNASPSYEYRSIRVSQSYVDFGAFYGSTPVYRSKTIWLRNAGDVEAERIQVWGSGYGFNTHDTCYGRLRPYSSCTITIDFRGYSAGYYNGRINIDAFDADGRRFPSEYVSLRAQVTPRRP